MLINEFSKPVTLESLNENLAQRFGQKIDVSKFTREQLEDARNKLRTQISQIETNESYEAVNTDSYQKSKLFLDIINKAIDEMSDSENTTPETEEKIVEGAEEQSALVMAAKDMVDRVTGWMEDTAEMQTESMLEIGDKIRDEYGIDKSEEFINTVKPALEGLFTSLESTRDSLTGGVAILTGEGAPQTMGDEVPAEEPEMEPTVDDEAGAEAEDPAGDEFGASGPAAGEDEEADRPKRESVELSKRLGLLLADSKKKAID
tara:strand:+ start:1195 stop:1977 length:783 start_codon:yes stop_codon:yes gene_type:complete